jgi:hypothetical protein
VAVVMALGLLLAGCTQSDTPKSYTTEVKNNFTTTCKEANDRDNKIADSEAYCGCVLDRMEQTYKIDKFIALNDDLRKNFGDFDTRDKIKAKYPEFVDIVDSCVSAGPSAPSGATTTTKGA